MKEKNYWKMIGIDLLLNYSRVKWRKNLLRLETLASLLLQTLFPTVLLDLHHGIHGDLHRHPWRPCSGSDEPRSWRWQKVNTTSCWIWIRVWDDNGVKRVWGFYCLGVWKESVYWIGGRSVVLLLFLQYINNCFNMLK